jgi:non-ribosomal peptide synthetase component F
VAFAVSESSQYQLRLDGMEVEPLMSGLTTASARYEMTFDFSETPAGLSGSVEYRSDLFSRETVENLLSQYVLLLEQIVDDPGESIDEYELRTSWDRGLQLDWQLGTENQSGA